MAAVVRPDRTGFTWNAGAARYRDPRTGRFVPTSSVRAALDATLDQYKLEAKALAEQLRGGALSLRAFDQAMRQLVKDTHLMTSASAVGGWQQLLDDPAALGRAGRLIRTQYRFLDAFVRDVATGDQTLGGSLSIRASMYIDAGRNTYEKQRTVLERAAGFDQERSIRHVSDSCATCVSEAARSWVAIGTLIPIGQRDCLTNCRCTIERRRSGAAAQPRRAPRTRRRSAA
jgi:hypothetical protein